MARVTIYDVAQAAGVSYQTVSRVLNDRPDVAEKTRERVKNIIAEMGFVPQAAARRLGSGKHTALGLLMPSLGHPYWARVADGIQSCCTCKGLGFLVGSTHDDLAEERRQLGIMQEHGVSGIALFPCIQSDIIAEMRRYGIPTVTVGPMRTHEVDMAHVDDMGGTRAITELLIQRGHRRIALLNGAPRYWQSSWRQEGYLTALREANINTDESLIKITEFTAQGGAQAAADALDMADPPTALVAASPILATGMLNLLAQRRIRVPDEIAVAAYTDGITLPDHVTYATCEPIEEMGYRAAEMLFDRLQGYDGPPREYILSYQVHVGTSSG